MPILSRRRKQTRSAENSTLGLWLSSSGALPVGYTRLIDRPEVIACVRAIVNPIAGATIYLMQNTPDGDKRIKNGMSRFVDITPSPMLGTRRSLIDWTVSYLLTEGNGNALWLPHYIGGKLTELEPMPGVSLIPGAENRSYTAAWRNNVYPSENLIHFRLHPDLTEPWRGRGYTDALTTITKSLANTAALKDSLCSPDYKPPLLIFVSTDSDLQDESKREAFRKSFLEDSDKGKPWILPADMAKVESIKPLSLSDLAIKDNVELDKRTLAAIFGVPAFLTGIGSFNKDEYNLFVSTIVVPIAQMIEQTLTDALLFDESLYFMFSRRRLYYYDLSTLMDVDLSLSDRGLLTGDEVRADANRDPAGLKDYRVLENYIPYDMAALQKKLKGKGDD